MKRVFFLVASLFLFLSVIQGQDLSYPTNCGEALLTDFQHIGPSGGNFSFNVTAPPTCTYSIVSISPAIVTSPNMATGNSTVTYTVDNNNSLSNPRYGVIIVGAKTFTVNQGVAKSGIDAKKTELDFNRDRNSDFVAIQNNGGNMTWWSYRFHGTPGASTSVAT